MGCQMHRLGSVWDGNSEVITNHTRRFTRLAEKMLLSNQVAAPNLLDATLANRGPFAARWWCIITLIPIKLPCGCPSHVSSKGFRARTKAKSAHVPEYRHLVATEECGSTGAVFRISGAPLE